MKIRFTCSKPSIGIEDIITAGLLDTTFSVTSIIADSSVAVFSSTVSLDLVFSASPTGFTATDNGLTIDFLISFVFTVFFLGPD